MIAVSVIIPVYNDRAGLEVTVRSLLGQTLPAARYEILVIDNGSTDDTLAAAREMAARHPGRMRILEERSVQSSYAARNAGIAVACGQIICFIDADMVVPAAYLAAVVRHFDANPECLYLGCNVRVEYEVRTLAAELDAILGFPIADYMDQLHYAPTSCLSVRARLFETVGPFDAGLESGGDFEFGRRVHERGMPQDFMDDVTLVHPARASVEALLKKRRRVARGHARLLERYPGRFEMLRGSYRWRRFVRRPLRVARIRARARERSIDLSPWRVLRLAALWTCLEAASAWAFRREQRACKGN